MKEVGGRIVDELTPWHQLPESQRRRILDSIRDSRLIRKTDPTKKKKTSKRKKHTTITRNTPTTSEELNAVLNMIQSGDIDRRYSYLIQKNPQLLIRINESREKQGKEPLNGQSI